MKQHVIVGYSGSGGSDALALGIALQAADREQTLELTVVSVYPGDPRGRPLDGDADRRLAAEAANRQAEARTRYQDRPGVSFVVRGSSSPARVLHALAEDLDADLIVVGRSHAGSVGRVFSGSVTEQTFHGSPCAVAVAPVGYASGSHEFATVGVAIDTSPDADRTVSAAAGIARRVGAELHLVHALTPLPSPYGGFIAPYPLQDRRDDAETILAEARSRVPEGTVKTHVLVGDPVQVMTTVSQRIDLLVIGSRSFGPVQRVLLGSVSSRLARYCPAPLIVVPRTAHVEEPPPTERQPGASTGG